MKKLFTFAAALLFGMSAMAVEPTLESTGWTNDEAAPTAFADVFKTHSCGVTLSTDQTAWKGNLTGHMYVVSGGGTDWSAASLTNWVGVSATSTIDSIAVLWAPNGTNASSVAWVGWESGVTPNAEVGTNYGVGETYTASKSWEAAKWETFRFAGKDLTTVYFSRQWKKAKNNGTVISNFGGNQTINFLGFMVWVSGQAGATKYTVTYYDGTTVLGTEKVKAGETPANAAQYANKAHHTFDGWYNDAAFTSAASLTAAINADKAFYGKWTAEARTYSSSVNIEQYVLDNGKNNAGIKAAFDAAHIVYANINDLDSLNDSKDARNEPYLGLKIKAAGGYVEVGLHNGDVLRVKFGNVAADIKVNGTTVAKADVASGYEYTATADEYVKIETTTSGTVVLKQIMINQPFAEVILPGTVTSLDEVAEEKAQKMIINGQLVIVKGGVKYNALGAVIE